jgi:hypothetical protein
MAPISPTQSNAQAALAAFLGAILPGIPGQQPAVFTGAIAGTTLTVGALPGKQPAGILGTIQPNAPLLGLGVAPGTTIVQQLSGASGGIGTYQVASAQSVGQATMSTGVTIVAGQQNRVAEPANPYFCVFTPIQFKRLATNLDTAADCKLAGLIVGAVLTVSDVAFGSIIPPCALFGTGVASSTTVLSQASGFPLGQAGTYNVAPAQAAAKATMSAGTKSMLQSAELVVQCDFHSPDTLAGDFAQTVSTALRDEFGTTFFASINANITPLYADDPAQRPFTNAENQFEWRWSLDVHLEVDQTVVVPQLYADSVEAELIDVDATFPP